jgi:rubredoxin
MLQWMCDVCGYVHDDEDPPGVCPVCGAPGSKFREYVDEDDMGVSDEDDDFDSDDDFDDYEK